MRSFLTYGLISLAGVASLYACGDDSGDDGPVGGAGGSSGAGAGAAAGQGGTAGNTSMAGNGGGGAGGAGGAAPDVTPQATCVGCVELITPVSGANSATNLADQAIFQFSFPAPGADFTNGVITWKLMPLQNNDNLFINLFAQNGPPDGYNGVYPVYRALSVANFPAGMWTDVVLDISAYRGTVAADAGADADPPPVAAADAGDAGVVAPLDPGTFIKERVQFIGIQVGTSAMFAGATTVRVAVDSVTIAGVPGQTGYTFDANAQGLTANTYELPPGTPAPVFH